jgi:arylsulfatase A-like enzyme
LPQEPAAPAEPITTRPAIEPWEPPTSRPAPPPTDVPNIVLLFADDLAPGWTGFEGHQVVRTPRLNQLAAQGAWFARCYVHTPMDAPTQATVLTGQYPHTHGVTREEGALKRFADTVTERLFRAGYRCGIVGNLRLPDERAWRPGLGLADCAAIDDGAWNGATTWVNGREARAEGYLIDWQTDRAIAFIEEHRRRPFFLWVCFRAPREPLAYPPGMESLYPPEAMKPPVTAELDVTNRPRKLNGSALAKQFDVHEKTLGEERSKYAALVTRLDRNVGRLLDHLETSGLSGKTVVVFAAGNGMALGDHGLFGTGTAFYDEFVRVPLLVRYPRAARAGTKIERVVGLVDLAPTLLELAGLPRAMVMQGQSFVTLLKEPDDPHWADEEFFECDAPGAGPGPVPTGARSGAGSILAAGAVAQPSGSPPASGGAAFSARGLVTRHYKFVDYLDGSSTLYDLKRDPDEMEDIGAILNNPSHPRYHDYTRTYGPVQKVLRDRLTLWRKQTKDLK